MRPLDTTPQAEQVQLEVLGAWSRRNGCRLESSFPNCAESFCWKACGGGIRNTMEDKQSWQ